MNRKKQTKAKNTKLKWIAALIGTLAIFAIWRNAQKNYRLPEELAGEWKSSDPRYADRSFELSQGYVSLATGDGTAVSGFIQEVTVSQDGVGTLYTITYKHDEGVNEMSLYYESSHGEKIRFKNQPNIVWTKVPGS